MKRFPDALSKTVPIWCDALNRACARAKRDAGAADADDRAWFEGPHLPEWVAEHERNSIRALVPEFEASLKSTGWDVGELAAILEKPFRCVWVSQGRRRRRTLARVARRGGLYSAYTRHGERAAALAR